MDHYVLLDLETTGLDPTTEDILEVAAIYLGTDLNSLKGDPPRFNDISGTHIPFSRLDPYVQEMHAKSGLWAEICDVPPYPLANDFVAWMRETFAPDPGSVILVGDSVHFDLAFLRAERCQDLNLLLSHRVVDVSGMSRVLRQWGAPLTNKTDTPAHRAMADNEDCLLRLKEMQGILKT